LTVDEDELETFEKTRACSVCVRELRDRCTLGAAAWQKHTYSTVYLGQAVGVIQFVHSDPGRGVTPRRWEWTSKEELETN